MDHNSWLQSKLEKFERSAGVSPHSLESSLLWQFVECLEHSFLQPDELLTIKEVLTNVSDMLIDDGTPKAIQQMVEDYKERLKTLSKKVDNLLPVE